MQLILSALVAMAAKLLTAELVQFIVLRGLEEAVKLTKTQLDDEFVAKAKEILERK